MASLSVSLDKLWKVKGIRSSSFHLEQAQQLLEASGIRDWERCSEVCRYFDDSEPDWEELEEQSTELALPRKKGAEKAAADVCRRMVWPVPITKTAAGKAAKRSRRVTAHQTGPGAQEATLRSFIADLSWVMLQRIVACPEDVADAIAGVVD